MKYLSSLIGFEFFMYKEFTITEIIKHGYVRLQQS